MDQTPTPWNEPTPRAVALHLVILLWELGAVMISVSLLPQS